MIWDFPSKYDIFLGLILGWDNMWISNRVWMLVGLWDWKYYPWVDLMMKKCKSSLAVSFLAHGSYNEKWILGKKVIYKRIFKCWVLNRGGNINLNQMNLLYMPMFYDKIFIGTTWCEHCMSCLEYWGGGSWSTTREL